MSSAPDFSRAAWRKSSYSGDNGGNCVEFAPGFPGVVPVRDSKDLSRPVLVFPSGGWSSFVAALRADPSPLSSTV